MSYQQGHVSLGNGVSIATVVFPAAYTSTPELIIPVIENSVDVAPLGLSVVITAKSGTGFSVKLSAATNSANYKLVWLAGSTAMVYQLVSLLGIRMSDTPLYSGCPADNDYFPFVSTNGIPTTSRIKWSTIIGLLGRMVASPPAAPTSDGESGNWAFDSKFFYTHDGTLWGRSPRVTDSWDLYAATELVQEGTATLAQDVQTISVVFDTPFVVDPPHVTFSFENVGVQPTKQILAGLVTARSITGFTVVMNTTPDTAYYRMHWRATGAHSLT